MDFFKTQFDRVRVQLAGLTPSQKMLSAALVAIMVMTLWWWGKYAGQPEMEAILDQQLSKDEIARISAELSSRGIDSKVSPDNKVLVSPDKKNAALAHLAYGNMLPKSTANGFDETIKKLTSWDGQSRENAIFNRGREMALEQVIGEFPGVSSAKVFIDPQFRRQIPRNVEPTANVTIATRDGSGDFKRLAGAAANIVSGAQSGITPSKVRVVINGKVIPVADPAAGNEGGLAADTVLETKQAFEASLTSKLERHLDYIPGVRVMVAVRVNNEVRTNQTTTYDKATSIIEPGQTTNRTTEEVNAPNTPLEAATVPNTGDSSVAQAAPGRTKTDTTESTTFTVLPSKTVTDTKTPAGTAVSVGASVRVPRSHFVLVAKGLDPAAKEPDPAVLEKTMAEEIARIRKAVVVGVELGSAERMSPDAITVEPYADIVPLADKVAAPVVASTVTGMLGGHVKEIVLGGLAVVSLFMMSMIVRKGSPTPAPAVAAAIATPVTAPAAAAGEAHAGEATDGQTTLDGVELDDDSIRTQQMLAQVTDLVGENPDAAATLLKRWMNQR